MLPTIACPPSWTVTVLDADGLVSTSTQSSQRSDLRGVGAEQSRGSRGHRSHPAFATLTSTHPGQHGHRGGVGAGHLHRQCRLDFVLGCRGLDHRERCIDGGL